RGTTAAGACLAGQRARTAQHGATCGAAGVRRVHRRRGPRPACIRGARGNRRRARPRRDRGRAGTRRRRGRAGRGGARPLAPGAVPAPRPLGPAASRGGARLKMRWRQRLPLSLQYGGLALAYLVAAAALALLLSQWLAPAWSVLLAVALLAPLLLYHVQRVFAPMRALFRALSGSVASYRDGDFAFGVSWAGNDELGELVASHNALGDVLREQRLALVQRELLLDTMVQNTPVAMLLVDPGRHVVHANIAARKLLGDGHRLEGKDFEALLEATPDAVREAFARGGDGMFTVGGDDGSDDGNEEIFHLARRQFRLNGRRHELVLLRQLTAELRRQEVQTWKKVIRVISHELNNSLAPIASLAHSGAELLRRGQLERLPMALATIEDRARHLEGFIRDYAHFAKLPA